MQRFGWVLFGMALGAGAATLLTRHKQGIRQPEIKHLHSRLTQLEQEVAHYRAQAEAAAQREAEEDAALDELEAEHADWWQGLTPDARMYIEMNRAVYNSRAKQKYQPDSEADAEEFDDV